MAGGPDRRSRRRWTIARDTTTTLQTAMTTATGFTAVTRAAGAPK